MRPLLNLVTIIGVSYFGSVILLLSLFSTQFNPISDPASDYGIGAFAMEMNSGFLVAGIGMLAFAFTTRRISRAAPVLLTAAGFVLIMDSYFHTNAPGTLADTGAVIHGFGGLFFFITAPIGILLVSYRLGRAGFLTALSGLVVGFVLLGANLGLGGLAERILLLVIFTSVISMSLVLSGSQKSNVLR